MERSEQVTDLFAALAKAQGAYGAATKDRDNPQFGSSYATLASGWNAARAALSANGLCVVQSVQTEENGVDVETLLGHGSGQWLSSKLFVPAANFTAQGLGSASTYARRYALFAMLGIAPEDDDDGNEATDQLKGKQPAQRQERKPAAPVQPEGDPVAWVFPSGKNVGKKLGDLTNPQLHWYATEYSGGDKQLPKRARAVLDRREQQAEAAAREAKAKADADTNNEWGLVDEAAAAREAEAEVMHGANDS